MDKLTEEQKEKVEKNHNLIYSFAIKYKLDIEDYYDVLSISLCKAALYFDETRKNSFSTFAYKIMLNDIRTVARNDRKKQKIGKLIYYQDDTNENHKSDFLDIIPDDRVNIEDDIIFKFHINEIMNKLSDRDLKILYLLMDGYTQREIGKMINTSQVLVSRTKKKITNLIRRIRNESIN